MVMREIWPQRGWAIGGEGGGLTKWGPGIDKQVNDYFHRFLRADNGKKTKCGREIARFLLDTLSLRCYWDIMTWFQIGNWKIVLELRKSEVYISAYVTYRYKSGHHLQTGEYSNCECRCNNLEGDPQVRRGKESKWCWLANGWWTDKEVTGNIQKNQEN